MDGHPHRHLQRSFPPVGLLLHLCARGEARVQQIYCPTLDLGPAQDLGAARDHRATSAGGIPPYHRMGWQVLRPMAHAVLVGGPLVIFG